MDEQNVGYMIDYENRSIYIYGSITTTQISEVCFGLLKMLNTDKFESEHIVDYEYDPIDIYITSNGGELDPSWGLIDIILNSETPIYTHCIGYAYSAAFNIYLAGHKRFAYPHSSFLYHQLASGVYGKFMDMSECLDNFKYSQQEIEDYILLRTKITLEELEANRQTKRDWFFTYHDAIKYGIITEIDNEE